MNEAIEYIRQGLAWLAAVGIVVDITPGIKVQPVRYLIKQIGNLINHDIKEKLDKIDRDLQQHKIETWRKDILSFANDCMEHPGAQTKEDFKNYYDEYSAYEEYIEAHELKNGLVDASHKYVESVYQECAKSGFLIREVKSIE